jgi:8-oxo-dGTP pyrophosphatase MutT (NUDIX family)
MPGGGIVVHHRTPEGVDTILIGQESNWLSDLGRDILLDGVSRRLGGKREQTANNLEVVLGGDLAAAKLTFTNRAQRLSTAARRIQYEQVKEIPGVGWTTKFHYLHHETLGVPKGGVETVTAANGTTRPETGKEAAVREFTEEIGMNVPDGVLGEPINVEEYQFFQWNASVRARAVLLDVVADRRAQHYSELFDVKFMTMAEYDTKRHLFNAKSRRAIDAFRATWPAFVAPATATATVTATATAPMGGRRRTRRKRRARARRSSGFP